MDEGAYAALNRRGDNYDLEAKGLIDELLKACGASDEERDRLRDAFTLHELGGDPSQADTDRCRSAFEKDVLEPVERHIFGDKALPRDWAFLHEAGDPEHPTTAVSTLDHYGRRYHAFAEVHTEDSLKKELLNFLKSERKLVATAVRDGKTLIASALLEMEDEETKARLQRARRPPARPPRSPSRRTAATAGRDELPLPALRLTQARRRARPAS